MIQFNGTAIMNQVTLFVTYKITNIINNKCYYGWTSKSITSRFTKHCRSAKSGSTLLLHNAIRKYGQQNFIVEKECTFDSKAEALLHEIELISVNKSNHCRFPGIGYNMTDGGEGTVGGRRSDEFKKHCGLRLAAYNRTMKGKTYEDKYGVNAEQERLSRGNSHRGKKASTQTRKKLSQAKHGNKNGCFPVKVTYENGDTIIYPSRDDAKRALHIKTLTTLRSIATGKRWRNGIWEKYHSPYSFTIEFLDSKV